MRILVTGKDGQVGRAFSILAPSLGELIAVGRVECDLRDDASIRAAVRRSQPDVIVNAAAYTAVDQAERERDLCFQVNGHAPGIMAEESARLGALLIHYSTDYVFEGEKEAPYVESDPVKPLSVYGASKAAGEQAIALAGCRYLVLRTTWVYAAQGRNFLLTMLRLGAERPELRVVSDQIGAPTSATAIAQATARLIERSQADAARVPSGIYHITAAGSTSWFGFAEAIFARIAAARRPQLLPISTAEYPTPAQRPKNSLLCNDKFEREFGFRLGPWQEQLDEVMSHVRSVS